MEFFIAVKNFSLGMAVSFRTNKIYPIDKLPICSLGGTSKAVAKYLRKEGYIKMSDPPDLITLVKAVLLSKIKE